MAKKKLKRANVDWTNKGRAEGAIKVEKAQRRRLNVQHQSVGHTPVKIEKRSVPIMAAKPGVEVKIPRHQGTVTLTSETLEWVPLITVGSAVKLKFDLMDKGSDYPFTGSDYPFKIAERYFSSSKQTPAIIEKNTIARKGTLAIYLGPTRIEERSWAGDVIREFRHLFIIGTGCYVVLNLNLLELP